MVGIIDVVIAEIVEKKLNIPYLMPANKII
jgi:hypothetical protein